MSSVGNSAGKAALRERMQRERAALKPAWVAEHSVAVAAQVAASAPFRQARAVALYLAMPGEVATDGLLARCRSEGRRVCVPVRIPGAGYDFAWLDEGERMTAGPWGIGQPAAPRRLGPDDALDLVLAPGLAFDRRGGRVGHGRGFYDSLCARDCARGAVRMGVAFDFQVTDEGVPMEAHDARMHAVATESGIVWIGG